MKIFSKRVDQPNWPALVNGDPAYFENALTAAAPLGALTLDDVIAQLDDDEQTKVLRYWQRSRWASSGKTDAESELQRVFAKGPVWRETTVAKSGKLPPLYPQG